MRLFHRDARESARRTRLSLIGRHDLLAHVPVVAFATADTMTAPAHLGDLADVA
jgi:hypothetical protein